MLNSVLDINECLPRGGKGPCEHSCTNTNGSFTCSCKRGFKLNADGINCVGESPVYDLGFKTTKKNHCDGNIFKYSFTL